MTQPDKWNDVAFDLFMGITRREIEENGGPFIERLADALRSAYAQGERAGMGPDARTVSEAFDEGERAGIAQGLAQARHVICETWHELCAEKKLRPGSPVEEAVGRVLINVDAIRAAKETKNPPASS